MTKLAHFKTFVTLYVILLYFTESMVILAFHNTAKCTLFFRFQSYHRNYRFGLKLLVIEMATAQRTRPRAVVGAPRRAAWQLKSALRHSISAAPRTIIFLHFFYNYSIVGDVLFMNNNG